MTVPLVPAFPLFTALTEAIGALFQDKTSRPGKTFVPAIYWGRFANHNPPFEPTSGHDAVRLRP